MSSRMRTHFALGVAAALVVGVAGQSSDVTECIPTYDWSFNSKGQTPCLVAAYLESACGTPTSVDAIPNGTHYLGPTFAEIDPCRCSSVTYSLISACGGCQNRSFTDWVNWTASCTTVEDSQFPKPVPDGTDIPAWAFLNLTITNENFDPVVAAALAGSTFSTTSSPSVTQPTPTPSSSSFTSSQASTSAAPSDPADSAPSSKSHSNAGAIAGGVVGGLVFLALVVLGLLYYCIRKRRNAVQKDLTFDSNALFAGPAMTQTTGSSSQPMQPGLGSSPAAFSRSAYDTSDLSTYPGSPVTSAVYTHLPGSTARGSQRSVDSVSPSILQLGGGSGGGSTSGPLRPVQFQQQRGFTGAAELA